LATALITTISRGLIKVISRRATGFHRWIKLLYIKKKLSPRWSNQGSKMVLTVGLFAPCPALNETPAIA